MSVCTRIYGQNYRLAAIFLISVVFSGSKEHNKTDRLFPPNDSLSMQQLATMLFFFLSLVLVWPWYKKHELFCGVEKNHSLFSSSFSYNFNTIHLVLPHWPSGQPFHNFKTRLDLEQGPHSLMRTVW